MSVTLEGRLRDTIRDGGNPSSTYHYANVESYSGESQDKYIITSVASAEMTECLLNDTYYGTSYKLEVFAEYSGTLYSIGYFDGGSGNSTRSTIYNFVLTANEETKIKLTNDQPTRIQVKPLSGYWNVLSGIYATNQPYLSFNTAVRFSNPTAPTQVLVSKSAVAPGEAVTLSWSGAKPGTRNPIKQYEIYRATS